MFYLPINIVYYKNPNSDIKQGLILIKYNNKIKNS